MRNILKFSGRKQVVGAALLAASAAFLAAKPAQATPATLGFYPATDIYGDKVFHFDADRYSTTDFRGAGSFDTAGLTYGIGDREGAFGRSEIGFDYALNGVAGKADNQLFYNAKTQLYNNSDNGTRVVGGIWLAGPSNNIGVSNTGYILGSKSFSFGRIHAGIAHAFTDKNIGGNAADTTFVQLGFDRAITSKLLFAADYYSGESAISGIQPTIYYAVNDKASFGIGYFFNKEINGVGDNDQLYLCFDYNFGGPKSSPPAEGSPGAPGG